MHRYVDEKDVNGFKGELIVLSDGDFDQIDAKTCKRLKNSKDYVIGFFEDDISICTRKDIEEEYQNVKNEGEDRCFDEWLTDRDILFIIVKDR